MLTIPAFGEPRVINNPENATAHVYIIEEASRDLFARYCTLLEQEGYEKREEHERETAIYAAFQKGDEGIFLSYYDNLQEITLVTEQDCRYFSYTDVCRKVSVTPLVTQVFLEDYGMSYVIRLSDGRFIIIDGGVDVENHRKNLWSCLQEQNVLEKPVIACWILTHPHSDHYHCFMGFMKDYGDKVTVEKYLLNFPEADDLEHYPKLANGNTTFGYNTAGILNIPRMHSAIQASGAPVYMAHTGQRYRIGDAYCEIFASMDDTTHRSKKINALSLAIRMELGGQVIFWGTDVSFDFARLPERYGEDLKADILQIPHHGFQCGDADAEIRGYELVRPRVCFLPVSDFNAFTAFCIHKNGTYHIMRNVGVEEILTGETQKTIALPYTAEPRAKELLARSCIRGMDNCGARTWIFTGLSTDRPEDFVFTLLNTTHAIVPVKAELFFEEKANAVRDIRIELNPLCFKTLSVIGDEVKTEESYVKTMSLKTRGIPQGVPFAIRFISHVPVVISHRDHTATYRSEHN